MIEVFRAITGPSDYESGRGMVFAGVSVEEIATRGIACSNDSVAQSYNRSLLIGESDVLRSVSGLPVFLSRIEAELWLRASCFRTSEHPPLLNLAVLRRVAVDDELIEDGVIPIFSNSLTGAEDKRLDLETLQAHQNGEAPIGSECFIPYFPVDGSGVARTLWNASAFFVPRAYTPTGEIDFSIDPVFTDLAEFVDLDQYGPDLV